MGKALDYTLGVTLPLILTANMALGNGLPKTSEEYKERQPTYLGLTSDETSIRYTSGMYTQENPDRFFPALKDKQKIWEFMGMNSEQLLYTIRVLAPERGMNLSSLIGINNTNKYSEFAPELSEAAGLWKDYQTETIAEKIKGINLEMSILSDALNSPDSVDVKKKYQTLSQEKTYLEFLRDNLGKKNGNKF